MVLHTNSTHLVDLGRQEQRGEPHRRILARELERPRNGHHRSDGDEEAGEAVPEALDQRPQELKVVDRAGEREEKIMSVTPLLARKRRITPSPPVRPAHAWPSKQYFRKGPLGTKTRRVMNFRTQMTRIAIGVEEQQLPCMKNAHTCRPI